MTATQGTATSAEESALTNLQPIKDLAKNWDIDIAACLEEYLHELGAGDLALEGPGDNANQADTLNFSEAALVLQNSSNVYGRKVEYLYKLVQQVHEELITNALNRNSAAAGNTNGGAGKKVDAEIEDFNAFDPSLEFLLLDDVLPTDESGNNINLQTEGGGDSAGRGEPGLSFATSKSTTRLSLGTTFADRTSASAHGVAQRFGFGSLQDAGRLRLIDGKCDLGRDGILIMPGAGGTLGAKAPRSSFLPASPFSHAGGDLPSQTAPEGAGDVVDFGNTSMGGGDFDYDDNAGFGFDDGGVSLAPSDKGPALSTPTKENQNAKSAQPSKKKDDPWALLDPHFQDPSEPKRRPLRTRNTCKLPATMTELPSMGVTGARTKRKNKQAASNSEHIANKQAISMKQPFVLDLLERILAQGAADDDDMPQLIPLNAMSYGEEFKYISKANAQRRAQLKRSEFQGSNKHSEQDVQDDAPGFYDNDDGYGSPDFGDGDDGMFGNDEDVFGNVGMPQGEDLLGEHGHDADNVGTKTFEELCRAHIQQFARTAEAYANETRLSKRVGEWHEKLVPILELEENRHDFDIHKYTERVIDAIADACNEKNAEDTALGKDFDGERIVDFSVATKDCPRFEVCRLFLASLSLANAGNVLLHHEYGEGDLLLELLDSEISNPMDAYFAPSTLEEN